MAGQRRADLIAKEAGKPGLRGKVNAKCIECIFDSEGGGGSWRKQVQDCTAVSCPLFSVRALSDTSTP